MLSIFYCPAPASALLDFLPQTTFLELEDPAFLSLLSFVPSCIILIVFKEKELVWFFFFFSLSLASFSFFLVFLPPHPTPPPFG